MGEPAPGPDDLLPHAAFLRNLARGLLGDEHRAEDAVQDALVVALTRPPPRPGGLRGWLAGVVRNVSLTIRRGERRRARRERGLPPPGSAPPAGETAERLELCRLLVDRVAALPEPYRDVLVRHYFDGLSTREIADRTGAPLATVQTRLRRALERLRTALDAEHGGDRRAWALLLPGVLPGPPRAATAVPALSKGVMLMSGKKLAAAAAVLVLASLGGTWIAMSGRAPASGASPPAGEGTPGADSPPEEAPGAESASGSLAPGGAPEPTAAEGAGENAAASAPEEEFTGNIHGTVVDVRTGEPVDGARAVYAVLDASGASWWGTGTGEDGRFRITSRKSSAAPGQRLELRVVARGYRIWRGPPSAAPRIELIPESRPPVPGRIRGVAVDSEHRPFTGPIVVITLDEVFASRHQRAWAGDDGSFLLEGVAPGRYEVFLDWSGWWGKGWTEVFVPDGGEVFATLSTPKPRESYALPPWTPAFEAECRLLEANLAETGSLPRERMKRLARLHRIREEARPRREVIVTGLPREGTAILEAERRSRRWRVEVRDGEARFPGLTTGEWTLTLERPGQPDVSGKVTVPEGDGPFTTAFPERD